jgi:hypothetical protein
VILLNSKIFVIVAFAVLVGILGIISITTSNIDTSDEGSTQEIKNQDLVITVELEDISILQVSERAAIIEIKFKLDNPNSRSVIANLLTYSLYASSDSEEYKIDSGGIGSRPEGMVDGSDYYTILSHNYIVLKDKLILEYPGNSPELMSILESSNPSWRVEGDVFFNLSSMTIGQENQVHFESRI